MQLTPLRLKKGHNENIRKGFPWIYAGDIIDSSELKFISAGSLVNIENFKGEHIGIGYYNANSQIACRMLASGKADIDIEFFIKRIKAALSQREKNITVPYYRLIHSEADGLPGLLIDRFGDVLVMQIGTAGMENLQPLIIDALEEVLQPKAIVLRNDNIARKLEGLAQEVRVIKGEVEKWVEVVENDCIYLADLINGQKTGWFYDQRDNRKMIAELAQGKSVVDIYSHSGGFGLLAAKSGASSVTLVDSSALALEMAQVAAILNKVNIECVKGDAFAVIESLEKADKKFDIVLTDPPAFVKSKKDIASGLKGYEKVAKLSANLVAENGLLFVASCSHYAGRSAFNKAVLDGVKKAGFFAEILKQTGAACDHPRHNLLLQSEYLKGILLRLTKI
jgi:23S rRNA (cytosine1962-C5)-methyltransferase